MKKNTLKYINSDNNSFHNKKNKNKFIILLIFVVIAICIVILKNIFNVQILKLFKNLFMLEYLPKLGDHTSNVIIFVFGVLASFHCIGMCGGITISQTISKNQVKTKRLNERAYMEFKPSLFYNIGRIISYTLIGGIIGGLGSIIGFTGALRGIVPIIGGIFMIIMAINLLGIFPFLRKINIRMPAFFARKIYKNDYNPIIVGLFTGLMPCGPLQIVQLYALGTRSAILGASSMFFFSIGTVPLVFIFGVANTLISQSFSKIILKVSAVLVLVLGIVMVGRGVSLYGISIPSVDQVTISSEGFSKIKGKSQIVKTELGSDTFPPIGVIKGIPVKWNLHVDEKNLNECNKSIQIPGYKIKKDLAVGDNIIEFTPDKEGQFIYTCWMGMMKSKIIVVDNFNKLKQDQITRSKK
ncbi:sulfite exporter TauE/SafE family protein [Clostridium sp.]|uniref:sulfite exporter TauE/SafE family protein n=1 Tax=Clostridium sp. TaxID=1506 RepID=UPI002FDCED4E